MCGIAGIIGDSERSRALLKVEAMKQQLRHRGPDGEGSWAGQRAVLGHTRLKIIDLSESASQPMVSEDGNFVIVYNGEVYNFQDLKAELGARCTWRSASDTEVILNAYRIWGPECLSKLNGMFAFAVWDIKNSSLFLARDRFGIKPLYYYRCSDELLFASEIKGLLATGIPAEACNEKVYQFLRWGALDYDDRTWFEGVRSLPAGSYAIYKNGSLTLTTYYRLEDQIDESRELAAASEDGFARFRELLRDSVRLQMKSDREVGIHLSGGVDSTMLSACAANIHNGPLKTYTFGYDEPDYDERPFARKAAALLGFSNFASTLAPADVERLMTQTLREEDEPFTSFRQLSHHKLYADYKAAGSTVILEASGGDEIGAGYTAYLFGRFLDLALQEGAVSAAEWFKTIKKNRFASEDLAAVFMLGATMNYAAVGSATSDGTPCVDARFLNPSFLEMHRNEVLTYRKPFKSHLRNQQYLDIAYAKLPRGLRYIERASMASSREARLPLLDHRLVEFGLQAPNSEKIDSRGVSRGYFQKILDELLPNRAAAENKRSIADPQRHWMSHDLSGYVADTLRSKKFKERGICNQQPVLDYWSDFRSDDLSKNSLTIFQPFITELWFQQFIDPGASPHG